MIVDRRLGYPIVIAADVRSQLAARVNGLKSRCIILCDANHRVAGLARDLALRLRRAPTVIGVRLGEQRKNAATLEWIWEEVARSGAGRDAIAVGVGGGVASDIFGLAAATYVRGIPYLHVATSLVAMADAAIGGKTGIDLRAGKNLAGVFADPIGVYVHVTALRTLPFRHLREGLAEIVKASIIDGGTLFRTLERFAPRHFADWPWEDVVARAIRVKTSIVAKDRTESGPRELLNLGHTFGHAFERASEYRITHGAAVALGLRAAGLLALRLGMFSAREQQRLEALLGKLQMPLGTSVQPKAAWEAMQYDKKRRNERLRFVLPRAIGRVEYGIEASERDVLSVLKEVGES